MIQLRADVHGDVLFHSDAHHTAPYYQWGYYGSKPVEDDPSHTIFLSSVEAMYLHSIDKLPSPLPSQTIQAVHQNPRRYSVYKQLRDNGWIVREGVQYGGDFLVYKGAPSDSHAPYVVLILPEHGLPWCIVAGLIRAASSARKQLVIAMPDGSFRLHSRWIPEQERMNSNYS